MTRTFYFEKGQIARENEGVLIWLVSPRAIQSIATTQGPNACFTDSDESDWTGDGFWRYAGDLRWDTYRVGILS